MITMYYIFFFFKQKTAYEISADETVAKHDEFFVSLKSAHLRHLIHEIDRHDHRVFVREDLRYRERRSTQILFPERLAREIPMGELGERRIAVRLGHVRQGPRDDLLVLGISRMVGTFGLQVREVKRPGIGVSHSVAVHHRHPLASVSE